VSVLKIVYEAVDDPPEIRGLLAVILMASPVVSLPPIVAVTFPFRFVPSVIVSVAEPVTDSEYVVPAAAIETTAPEEVAVTPMPDRWASPFMAVFKPVAIEVKVSPESTVYGTVSCPPDRLELDTVMDKTSPVVFDPPIVAVVLPFWSAENEIVSVGTPAVEPEYKRSVNAVESVGVIVITLLEEVTWSQRFPLPMSGSFSRALDKAVAIVEVVSVLRT
jgi:hypothetical protein